VFLVMLQHIWRHWGHLPSRSDETDDDRRWKVERLEIDSDAERRDNPDQTVDGSW
jgi:hypothetical protein